MERYNIDMQETQYLDRSPPPPSTIEDLSRQTPCLQVPGCHRDCVSQGGGSECCHTTASYPNLRNDCCICSKCRTTTRRRQSAATELHRGIRIESGWVFSHFQDLQLTLWQLDPLRGSAYIPLPRWIQIRRAVVNVAPQVTTVSSRSYWHAPRRDECTPQSEVCRTH